MDSSRASHGLKAYPAESRHRDRVWMVLNEAAGRREISAKIPLGAYRRASIRAWSLPTSSRQRPTWKWA